MRKKKEKNYLMWVLVGVVVVCIGIVAAVEADAATLQTALHAADSVKALSGTVLC